MMQGKHLFYQILLLHFTFRFYGDSSFWLSHFLQLWIAIHQHLIVYPAKLLNPHIVVWTKSFGISKKYQIFMKCLTVLVKNHIHLAEGDRGQSEYSQEGFPSSSTSKCWSKILRQCSPATELTLNKAMSALRLNPVKPTFHSQPVCWPGEHRLVSALGIWSQGFLEEDTHFFFSRVLKRKKRGNFIKTFLVRVQSRLVLTMFV